MVGDGPRVAAGPGSLVNPIVVEPQRCAVERCEQVMPGQRRGRHREGQAAGTEAEAYRVGAACLIPDKLVAAGAVIHRPEKRAYCRIEPEPKRERHRTGRKGGRTAQVVARGKPARRLSDDARYGRDGPRRREVGQPQHVGPRRGAGRLLELVSRNQIRQQRHASPLATTSVDADYVAHAPCHVT